MYNLIFSVSHDKIHLTAKCSLMLTAMKYTTAPHPSLERVPERACHFLVHQEKFMTGAGTLKVILFLLVWIAFTQ